MTSNQPYSGYPPPGGYPPQGGYPPPGGYPPQPGFQQPGYPQPGGYQGPPPTGFVNPGYPDPNMGGGGYIPPGGGAYPPPNNPPMYGGTNQDIEDGEVKGFDFSDKSIRLAFIRKVYATLMCQLLVTLGFIALLTFHRPTQLYVRQHPAIFYIALAVMFVTLISMACCTSVRRKTPMNFIFLAIFTLAESFMLGVVSSMYQAQEVILAVGITAAVCLALTLFAFQTKWDFTTMGSMLFVILIVFVLFGFIAMFFPGKIMTLVYSSIGALLFSFYLIYDTQLMIGGKHKMAISPEEYIFAALNLYLDVVNMFMYILSIIGASRN